MRRNVVLGIVCLFAIALTFGGCDLFGPAFSPDPITGAGTGLAAPWTFASGFVQPSGTAGVWSVELYGIDPDTGLQPWDLGAYPMGTPVIMFSAPSSAEAVKLQLKLFGDTSENQTVTFYDGTTNYIFIDGWLEFTVDESAGTAIVKLNMTTSDMSFDGTATVELAP